MGLLQLRDVTVTRATRKSCVSRRSALSTLTGCGQEASSRLVRQRGFMADIGIWRPAKGTHAIQLASLSITFAEPVNDRPWRRIEKLLAKAAVEHGLTTRQSVKTIEMRIQPHSAPSVQEPSDVGFEFLRQITPEFAAEKLQVRRDTLTYENWDYTRWAPMKRKAAALLKGAFGIYNESVEIAGVTASYVDLFLATTADGDAADAGLIIEPQSKSVAPGAFNPTKPWHTHSGWFEYPEPWCRRLRQVNVDVAEAMLPEGERRFVQIMTTVNDQFGQKGLEPMPVDEATWDRVLARLQNCHAELKEMLTSTLTKAAAQAISLEQPK